MNHALFWNIIRDSLYGHSCVYAHLFMLGPFSRGLLQAYYCEQEKRWSLLKMPRLSTFKTLSNNSDSEHEELDSLSSAHSSFFSYAAATPACSSSSSSSSSTPDSSTSPPAIELPANVPVTAPPVAKPSQLVLPVVSVSFLLGWGV